MKIRYAIIILIVLLSVLTVSEITARTTLTPFGRPRTVDYINSKGDSYTYYCLVKGESMGFAVEGPADIEIRTRAGLPNKDYQANYQVQVWEGEYLIEAAKNRSKLIDAEIAGSSLMPAAARDLQFNVPAGVHNYRLWLVSENIDTVFLRIYKDDPDSEEPEDIDLHLLKFKRLVHLYSKKNQTPYYLVDDVEGVELKVTGPTELLIRSRANFSTSMDGRVGYSLSISEHGNEIETITATTSKSLTMAYQDFTGVVPSRPNVHVLKVPAGNHIYKVLLKESMAETVSVRFSLAKQ